MVFKGVLGGARACVCVRACVREDGLSVFLLSFHCKNPALVYVS